METHLSWTFGMILKMSLINRRYVGIKEYFIQTKKTEPPCDNCVEINGMNADNWKHKDLTYGCFLLIPAALHLKHEQSDIDDMFVPGRHLQFD